MRYDIVSLRMPLSFFSRQASAGLAKLKADHGDAVVGIEGDVRFLDSHKQAVARCVETFGKLDCLVGNAGVWDYMAQLVDLADDDRATIYGALLELVGKARGDETGDTLALWKRRGKRAFDTDDDMEERLP